MEPATNSRKKQIITTLAVLIVIVAIVAAVTVANKKDSTADTTDTASTTKTEDSTASSTDSGTSSTTGSSRSTAAADSTYKDGTYTATGSYSSPGGNESITITVTLANDVITSTSAQSGATDSEAKEYQSDFISAYKSLVVGKNISSVSLSRVSGSSLTSQGFNNAIDKIESQAKA